MSTYIHYSKAWQDYQISPLYLITLLNLIILFKRNSKLPLVIVCMKQIKLFVPVFMACGGDELEGLDYMLTYKILRKFEALNLTFLKDELDELIVHLNKLFGKDVLRSQLTLY